MNRNIVVVTEKKKELSDKSVRFTHVLFLQRSPNLSWTRGFVLLLGNAMLRATEPIKTMTKAINFITVIGIVLLLFKAGLLKVKGQIEPG